MPNKPNTIAEQITSLNETVKENGVILPPKIKEYLDSNLRIILDKQHNNEDVTEEDVEFIKIIESYCLLSKEIRDEIQSIEEMLEKTEKIAEKLKLKEQFAERLITLKTYGFLDEKGEGKEGDAKLPSYERAINTLTLQELEVASHFQKPMLLIIPECSFKSKIKALDSHKIGMQEKDIEVTSGYYKTDKGSDKITNYKVSIVDGAEKMKVYEEDDLNATFQERMNIRKASRKLGEKGMDRNKYILLIMEFLRNGKPINIEACTILDDDSINTLEDTSFFPVALFSQDRCEVGFSLVPPSHHRDDLARLRSSIGGDTLIN